MGYFKRRIKEKIIGSIIAIIILAIGVAILIAKYGG